MKMKDKKAAQAEAKEKHLAGLNEAKARRRQEPSLLRAGPEKLEKQTILIVCEGKNTEPSYFKQFKLASATIKAVGTGIIPFRSLTRQLNSNQKVLMNKYGVCLIKTIFLQMISIML